MRNSENENNFHPTNCCSAVIATTLSKLSIDCAMRITYRQYSICVTNNSISASRSIFLLVSNDFITARSAHYISISFWKSARSENRHFSKGFIHNDNFLLSKSIYLQLSSHLSEWNMMKHISFIHRNHFECRIILRVHCIDSSESGAHTKFDNKRKAHNPKWIKPQSKVNEATKSKAQNETLYMRVIYKDKCLL